MRLEVAGDAPARRLMRSASSFTFEPLFVVLGVAALVRVRPRLAARAAPAPGTRSRSARASLLIVARAELAARDDRGRLPRPLPPAAERDHLRLGAAAPDPRAHAGDARGDRRARRPPVRVPHAADRRAAGVARRLVRRPPRRRLRRRAPQPVAPQRRAPVHDRDRAALLVAGARATSRESVPTLGADRVRLRGLRALGVPRPRAHVRAAALRLLREPARAALGDLGREGPEPRRHPDDAPSRRSSSSRVDRSGSRAPVPRGGRGASAAAAGSSTRARGAFCVEPVGASRLVVRRPAL